MKEMLIFHRIIPHKQQRYDTVGDWERASDDKLFITASKMKDPLHEDLILLHEQIEAQICCSTGVAEEDVTAFDVAYEESRRLKLQRASCGCLHYADPGDDHHAPYYEAHQAATACEQIIAKALGVDWLKYTQTIDGL